MMTRSLLLLTVALAVLGIIHQGGISVSYASHPQGRPLGPARSPAGRALVLEPFATQLGLGAGAGDPEVSKLQAAGFDVTELHDTAVTVQVMATLWQYNVIYANTHSDPFNGGDGVVATGQLANENDRSVASFVQDGSIVPVTVSTANGQSAEHYWAITSSFIRNHLGTFPGHSILVLNGCGILSAPVFAQTLQSQGLGVLVSWDKEATVTDNYLSGNAFLNEMGKGLSVSDALTAVKGAGLGTSHPQGQGTATMGFTGDGTITLQEASNSPTSTPVPPTSTPRPVPTKAAPTPTPIPLNTAAPTPTATATATSIPGPPLSIQLKARVKPGTRQVFVIRSVPDTIIHIHVRFPSGDSRTATTATDGKGIATYAFPQRASRIAYQQVYASVTIDAIKNSAITTKTVQYRILWGPIDVSVQPRVQAVSKSVTLWAHTSSRTRVRISLLFPKKGNVKRFFGVTGARGWVHIRYTIGQYLKNGSNHTVVVRARAQVGGKVVVATTTFQIV